MARCAHETFMFNPFAVTYYQAAIPYYLPPPNKLLVASEYLVLSNYEKSDEALVDFSPLPGIGNPARWLLDESHTHVEVLFVRHREAHRYDDHCGLHHVPCHSRIVS